MAHIVPSDLSRLALSGAHAPEVETLRLLRDALPDDYTVFHGVHWTREYHAWTHFGEIDFVVLNRSGDLLFIEQKNGVLQETDKGLSKEYQDGGTDPIRQVHRSIDKVRAKFQWQHGKYEQLNIDYLVYCPDYRIRNINAAGIDVGRVVDAGARDGLPNRIQSVLGPGVEVISGPRQRIEGFFLQTFDLVPDIHAHVSAQERSFVRQSGPMVEILANLEMSPFRLRIVGTAGSGKSLVARQFFHKQRAEDRRVLLVCYNRPLAERLKSGLGEGGHVNTWHGFCTEFLKSRGQTLDFEAMKTDPTFWKQIQEQVMGETIPDDWLFDALVVDEGQDFEAEWFEILKLFLRDGADILWLEDPDQNLQGKTPVALDGFVSYRCLTNYRSPERIARFMRDTLSFSFDPGNDLPGLGVAVHGYDAPDQQAKIAGKIVQDLMRRGFSHDDIVLLTCRGVRHSVFSELDQVGGLELRRFTGKYDSAGNQVLTEGRLTFDSVYRFKGQQAPAVILVDVDPDAERIAQAERLLYCGMTRATVKLDLICNKANPENRRFQDF